MHAERYAFTRKLNLFKVGRTNAKPFQHRRSVQANQQTLYTMSRKCISNNNVFIYVALALSLSLNEQRTYAQARVSFGPFQKWKYADHTSYDRSELRAFTTHTYAKWKWANKLEPLEQCLVMANKIYENPLSSRLSMNVL